MNAITTTLVPMGARPAPVAPEVVTPDEVIAPSAAPAAGVPDRTGVTMVVFLGALTAEVGTMPWWRVQIPEDAPTTGASARRAARNRYRAVSGFGSPSSRHELGYI